MLIWTPLNAAELQKAMHGGNVGPAALVPVQSGTVLLPPPGTRLNEAAYMANRVRKIGGGAALAVWNDDAALLYLFTTTLGRASMWGSREAILRLSAQAKQSGPVGLFFDRTTAGLVNLREKEKWQLDAIDKLTALHPSASRKAALEQDLHAHADAEHGPATGEALADDAGAAHRVQALHARRVRADAGHDQTVRLARGLRVRRHLDMGADPLKRALGGAQVAGAIVKYDDTCHDDQVSRWGRHPA
jgi:hypothetical protein